MEIIDSQRDTNHSPIRIRHSLNRRNKGKIGTPTKFFGTAIPEKHIVDYFLGFCQLLKNYFLGFYLYSPNYLFG